MKEKKIHNIFQTGTCLNIEQMQAYIAGKLSAKEEHLFEKHINACAFCRDEFEGLLAMKNPASLPLIINELNKSIDKQIVTESKKTRNNRNKVWKIAATLLLLIGSGIFISLYIQKMSSGYAEKETLSQEFEQIAPTHESSETVEDESGIRVEDKFDLTQNKPDKPLAETKEKITENKNTKEKLKENANEQTVYDEVIAGVDIEDSNAQTPTYSSISEDETEENDMTIAKENFTRDTENIIVSRAKILEPTLSKKQAVSYLHLGINAYKEKDYSTALEYFKIAEKQKENINKVFYYTGLSYYYTSDYKKSKNYFDKLSTETDNTYYWEALWFKSQIFRKQNKPKKAKELLKQISNSTSEYKKQAQKQLDSLKFSN